MKVWVTKYSFIDGIIRCYDATMSNNSSSMIVVRVDGGYAKYFHGEGKEWHRTIDSARERFYKMKQVKLDALGKGVKKVLALNPKIQEEPGEVLK